MQPDPHVVYENETIVAIATPPGRGGIGIMRLSGAEATRIAEPVAGCATLWPMHAALVVICSTSKPRRSSTRGS